MNALREWRRRSAAAETASRARYSVPFFRDCGTAQSRKSCPTSLAELNSLASRLIQNGTDIVTVKELLGHSTVVVTIRYAHTNEEAKAKHRVMGSGFKLAVLKTDKIYNGRLAEWLMAPVLKTGVGESLP